ncbi:uncharacterized protein LOC130802718 isoform X2 [Amaranthus tricolor]|uniref:uncharacterized protein LOC130802718 isoform X2 n=1 Tax=Amaranthus tricolor TaxID=29722 RepID=UPI002589B6CE|nr:uncharacterized protein LOC130802718 isoform X2 [Amaranthus tricolor]
MGALALPTPWIPQDDLLLKNAIEAGASLESLAKGAVQFSRRFTIKELQDRWLALLYDPIISMRAAEQMVELERSASNLVTKSNRVDHSKGSKNRNGKRNADSVRNCYYAMRKRICNDPLNQGDLIFLVAPGDNCFMGGGAEVHDPDNMLGDSIASHYGIEDSEFEDLSRVFPQVMRDGSQPCVGEFPIEQRNTHEDHVDWNTTPANNMDKKKFPRHSMLEGSGIQANQVCISKYICSGFEGNKILSPYSDYKTKFQHLQYTSAQPAIPDWKTTEGISMAEMPNNISIKGESGQTGDAFVPPDDGDVAGASEYDVMHTESEMNSQIPCDDEKNSTCPEGFFAELSDLNFTIEDDMLVMDGVKGGVLDKAYLDSLSSLLLDSPNHGMDEKLPNVVEANEPAASEVCSAILSNITQKEPNDSHLCDITFQNSSDIQLPTSTCVNSEFPEIHNSGICCTLNTEDPEIPSNDDIVFPSKQRSGSSNRRTQSEANNALSYSKVNTGSQPSVKGPSTTKREQKRFGESHLANQIRVPDDSRVKFETLRDESLNSPMVSGNGTGGPRQNSLAVIKKEPSEFSLSRQPSCAAAKKPGLITDLSHLQIAVGGTSQEALGSLECMAEEPGVDPLLSNPDQQSSESDSDIPYFSDVESMILDMDLGPEDQDSFWNREVAKYQTEYVKRTIIRLEQNAYSSMQRSIASHGAYAILYGRHSKHYIKKPEVLLGRATNDYPVDIDLGREGRANKISRRQAILKMDKDGAFNLKNTGKCSIYVNSKEIFPEQSLVLQSNCLIEGNAVYI